MTDPEKIWEIIAPYVKGFATTLALIIWISGLWPARDLAPNNRVWYGMFIGAIGLAMAVVAAWFQIPGYTFVIPVINAPFPMDFIKMGFIAIGISVFWISYFWKQGNVGI